MGFADRFRRRKGRKLTSPDGLPVTVLPPTWQAGVGLYGASGSYSAIYRTQPNVRAVVDFLAEQVAGIKIKLYERVSTSPKFPDGRIELSDHPEQLLLNRPSPRVSRTRLWRDTVSDIGIYDIAFWQKVRVAPSPSVRALVRIPPSAIWPERDPVTQRIVSYKTTLNTEIPIDDLVIFQGYDPDLQEGHVSPLETLRRILAEEHAAGRNREHTWRNATRKDGVVERPIEAAEWDEDQREAWRTEWEGVLAGDTNAGRVALLEDGMKWKDSAWSPQEMEYLGARELTRRECAAAFRVDPRLVFATDQPIDQDTRTSFYTDRLAPLLTRLAEEIDIQLLPDFEPFDADRRQYHQFNIEEKLRGSFSEEAKIASSAVGGPFVTVNEMRARRNLPPVPDGDQLFIPLNSIRAGGPQASPQSPVETPGDEPAVGETPGGGTQYWVIDRVKGEFVPALVPSQPEIHLHVNLAEPKQEEDQTKAWLDAELRCWLEAEQVFKAERLEGLLRKNLERQERAVRQLFGSARKFGPVVIEDVWDEARWSRELPADLADSGQMGEYEKAAEFLGLTRSLLVDALSNGGDLGGVFDAGRVREFVRNGSAGGTA